jgi:inner membrane protease subunit 1
MQAPKSPPSPSTPLRWLRHFARPASLVVRSAALIWVIQEYVFDVKPSYGPSMYPTIEYKGDRFVISRWNRRGRDVKVGDLVTIKHPWFEHQTSLKRITGLPGDFVVKEEKAGIDDSWDLHVEGMLQVPEGHFWCVGDNMVMSRDSREFGPLPLGMITGKIIARIGPWGRIGWMENGLKPT